VTIDCCHLASYMPRGEELSYTPEGAHHQADKPPGVAATPRHTEGEQQPSFEERYKHYFFGEFTQRDEDGTERTYVAYRGGFNRGSANGIQALAEFCRNAEAAGYTRGLTPEIHPDFGRDPETPDIPFDAFSFY
jgi:hypothetical protein